MKIKKLIKSLIYAIFRGTAVKKLKEKRSRCKTVNDYVDLAVSFNFSPFNLISFNIKPSQVKKEISELLKILRDKKPKTILEIGTANGGTLYMFAKIADPDAVLISMDLPGGPFGGGYQKWKSPFYRSFAQPGQKIHLLRADSHQKTTADKVKEILGDSKLDFLFIDGDHTYEGVKRDFEIYAGFVKKGGIAALHDIVPHPPETGCAVNKFWKEIRETRNTKEFVENWNQGWGGIGVVYF